MIIGVSGKSGSGKDRAAEFLINMITHGSPNPAETNAFFQVDGGWEGPYPENKKYAGKLKDIICLLIGCTREQLEDQDFKAKELGEEWTKTLWHIQSDDNNCETFYTEEEAQEGLSHWDENYNQEVYIESEKVKMTPRLMLQLMGTEGGRKLIHPSIWVNALFADYTEDKIWIISDVRFPDEVEAIVARGGIVIRLERDGLDTGTHLSETSLDGCEDLFDHVIDNNGSLKDLYTSLREIIKDV